MSVLFLNQLKVRSKLILGFGLVLLLTAAIAVSAWWALDNLIASDKQAEHVDGIESISKALDHAVLIYRSRADAESQAAVEQLLARLERELDHSRQLITDPAASDQLDAVHGHAQRYERAFEALVAAMQLRAQQSDLQGQAGATVNQAFDELDRNLVVNNPFDEALTKRLTRWTLETYRNFLSGRSMLMRYEQVRNDLALQQRGVAVVQEVLKSVTDLSSEFGDQDYRLIEGRDALQTYLAAYDQVAQAFIDEDGAVLAMTQANELLQSATQSLHDVLLAFRNEQTSLAKTTIFVAAVLAALVGLLIANLISRQITAPLRESLEAADRIALGDLTERPVAARGDEFGDLAERMAAMRENLRDLISSIDASTNQIGRAHV